MIINTDILHFRFRAKHIFALCLLFFCLGANAQVGERRNDFSVGLNAGMTMSSMDFVPKIKQGYKTSPTFGFWPVTFDSSRKVFSSDFAL